MNDQETLGRRKELRFKTADECSLQCECFYEDDAPKRGSVIDVSTHGLRFLCDGRFRSGQVVLIELKTEDSLGAFGGIVRRVTPWTGGQTVYGCELVEPLTEEVLKVLAQKGIVDRRGGDRVPWNRRAKMSWELQPGEIDIAIQDCSLGGLKIVSPTPIPENVSIRIRLEDEQEEVMMTAKTVWQAEKEGQSFAGLAFNHAQIPKIVTQAIAKSARSETLIQTFGSLSSVRPSLLVAAAVVLLCFTLLQTGILQTGIAP